MIHQYLLDRGLNTSRYLDPYCTFSGHFGLKNSTSRISQVKYSGDLNNEHLNNQNI